MIKTEKVITVKPDTSVKEVLQKMQSNFIKHIVVISNNKPVGIVTERDINRFLENDKTAKALEEISAEQVMKKEPITITEGEEETLNQIAESMDIFKIGSVIIVNEDQSLSGIVTRKDIVKLYGTVYAGKFRVKDHMTHRVFTCRMSDALKYALSMLNHNKVSRLVVTDSGGKALGIITTNTFLTNSSYFTKDSETCDYLLPSENEERTVGDLVSEELVAINVEDDLAIAAQKMIQNHINGIPVTDNSGMLIGVISSSDIIRAFVKVPLTKKLLEEYSKSY